MQIEVGEEYKRSQLHDAFGGNSCSNWG